jgi:hypothetical protein
MPATRDAAARVGKRRIVSPREVGLERLGVAAHDCIQRAMVLLDGFLECRCRHSCLLRSSRRSPSAFANVT